MGDGPQNGLRSTLQQIGEPNQQSAVPQPDGIVQIGKSKEFNLQFGQGRARTQLLIAFLENFEQALTHSDARLARESHRSLESDTAKTEFTISWPRYEVGSPRSVAASLRL